MENQSSTLSPGTVIRGPKRSYTVIKVLGQGGFGITYLVTGKIKVDNIVVEARFALKEHFISSLCSRDGKTCAVEFSAPVADEVSRSLHAFIKEAKRLQSLGIDHPNIVRINEVFEANNTAYYVMEYLGSTTLTDYVAQNGPLSPAAAKSMLRPVVEAVAMLHRNSIAHYDIKPGNIMLHEGDDGTLRPVLIDFGLSKHYDNRGHATSTIAAAGYTPGYAPSEQYAGIKKFTPQCDVYSLAATLYFCLTGRAPKPALELRLDEVEAEIAPILGPSDTASILRALAIFPEGRPRDASLLLAELFTTASEPVSPVPAAEETAKLPPVTSPFDDPADKETLKTPAAPSVKLSLKNITIPPSLRRRLPLILAIAIPLVIALAIFLWWVNQPYEPYTPYADFPKEKIENQSPQAFTPCQSYNNLDLYATLNGKNYFFSQSEWESLPDTEKNKYDRKGVVVIGDGLKFVLALHDTEHGMDWDDAMRRYGDSLPSKEQGEVMANQHEAINKAIIAFGGDKDPEFGYWTKTEYDSSHAWFVLMNNGEVGKFLTKESSYGVRTVSPVPTDDNMTVNLEHHFIPRQSYKNLDLYATRDGKNYFFSQGEWTSLSNAEKSKYNRKGIVVIGDGLEFVLALHDSGEIVTWNVAMRRYGDSLPSKEQAEAMAKQCKVINKAIIAFGSDKDSEFGYWTKTEYDSSRAWTVRMYYGSGSVHLNGKAGFGRVRVVSSIPTINASCTGSNYPTNTYNMKPTEK